MKKPKRLIHHLNYPKDTDKIMVGILDVLNSIPGCRTLYSCQGHGREPLYICLSFTCGHTERLVREIFSDNIKDLEVETELKPNGVYSFETFLGLYSLEVGTSPLVERRKMISKLKKELVELVPVNWW